jgi:aldehyde:ferredoxin oxidoreductase
MLCDDLGLDTISTGSAIGFAMELYERGIIKRDEVENELKFGNHEAMVEMISRIAYRKGFGDILAEGVRKAAQRIGKGAEKYSMHVKGLELPAYDPRGLKGMGLNYATACRGGCHNRAWTVAQEVFGGMDRFATDGKAELVKSEQDKTAVYDSAITCLFAGAVIGIDECSNLLTAVTGYDFGISKILTIGDRIINMERLFNLREGITRKDDALPERLLQDPIPRGASMGNVVNLDSMLDEYYRLREWDSEGVPTEKKLKELGL